MYGKKRIAHLTKNYNNEKEFNLADYNALQRYDNYTSTNQKKSVVTTAATTSQSYIPV